MTKPEATRAACSSEMRTKTDQWADALTRSIPMIYGMFVRKGLHAALAEELAQKSVFDAVRGRTAYDPGRGSLEQWLVGIARKNLAQEMRKRATRAQAQRGLDAYLSALDRERLPDRVLEDKETRQRVRAALASLPEPDQRVLMLKYLQDLSARAIADAMNLTEKAVHSLLYRARERLRDRLKALGPLNQEDSKP